MDQKVDRLGDIRRMIADAFDILGAEQKMRVQPRTPAAYPVDSGSSICSGVGGSAPLRGLSRFMMSQ